MTKPSRERIQLSSLFAIAGAAILLTLPVLILGLPSLSDDGVNHSLWLTYFSEQFWSGDLYPRWLVDMNAGLGSPVFFYYPPVPFFLTSLLRPFISNDSQSWHALGVSVSIALIASGITAYLWLREIAEERPALAAAILYLAMPYHLGEIYVRGALAEHWALVWVPLILFFAHRISRRLESAMIGLAIAYALLLMTHSPTTVIFSPIPVLYVWLISERHDRIRVALRTVLSMTLGAGLSAIFLLPALLTEQNVFISRMTSGYFSYGNWFLFSQWSLWKEDKVIHLLLAADMLAIAWWAFMLSSRARKSNRFWFVTALVSVFMMTEVSKPIWRLVPVLPKIQFSWRFNIILAVATTALLTHAIAHLSRASSAPSKIKKWIAIVLVFPWIPAVAIEGWQMFPQTNSDPLIQTKIRQIQEAREAPEYRPRWSQSLAQLDWDSSMNIDAWDSVLERELDSVLSNVPKDCQGKPTVLVQGAGTATVMKRQAREFRLAVETSTGVSVQLPQFYFPNWTAQTIETHQALVVSPSVPDGLISISVPSGRHEIELRLRQSKSEIAGEIVSSCSLIILSGLSVYLKVSRRSLKGEQRA